MTSRIQRRRRAFMITLGFGVMAATACTDPTSSSSLSQASVAAASTFAALLSPKASEGLQLVYHATFGNGSLDSGLDPLGLGPMKPGNAQVVNAIPTWAPEHNGIRLGVTRPTASVTGPVSSG